MNLKKICLEIAYCEDEESVIEILKREALWNPDENWQYFGNKENNYGDIGNQQSKPEGAIVEKIVNAVDAILTSECLKRKINPESDGAPNSIKLAQEQFFSIDEGKLFNLSGRERTRLADNISLVATGSRSNPCYSIIDLGEGQMPNKLPSTILSLGESNKLRIPFVQGKFNMGGTGVFRFCGTQNIQLIISKRHPEIAQYENDESKIFWGFTVIRRENPTKTVRNSTYKYLAPKNKILSFEAESLPLLPGQYPEAYLTDLCWGTFIKLYEYQIPGLRTNIILDLYNRLSILMPDIALPIRLLERRKGYSAKSYESTLSGLSVRLEEDKRNNLEEDFTTTGTLTVQSQRMKYTIFAFKKGKSEKYSKQEGVVFVINGQTHGYLSKSFFNRKAVGLGYLAESLLVVLDCSEFDGREREDLFKNDRETLVSCELKFKIEKELEDLLRNHEGLKILKEKRRREEIANKLEDSKPLAEVLNNILKNSPTLSKLFVRGFRLSNPFNVESKESGEQYIGKHFPNFFTLANKFPLNKPKKTYIKSRFRVQYSTDVSNDYFNRSKEPGTFKLFLNNKEINTFSLNLWNGYANLNVSINGFKAGEVLRFKSVVSDSNNLALPFTEEFYILVEKESNNKGKTGGNGRKPPPSNIKGSQSTYPSGLALPNVVNVKRDDWAIHKFDKESALKVVNNGETAYDFFVNVDNIHLLTELKPKKSDEIKLLEARYKYGLVLIGLAMLQDSSNKNGSSTDNEEDIYSTILKVTKMLSPIIIPMISSLGALELAEIEIQQTIE